MVAEAEHADRDDRHDEEEKAAGEAVGEDEELGSKFLFRGIFRERAKVREFLQGREFREISGNIEGK
eukprot:scaffold126855_cov23-Cyclotella_meneghiniana.AAC.2